MCRKIFIGSVTFFATKHMSKRSSVSFIILYIYDKMKKTRESERTDDRY